jgi:hypothetical protein
MDRLDRDLGVWGLMTDLAKTVSALAAFWQVTKVHQKVKTVDQNVNGKMEFLLRRNQQLRNLLAENRIEVPDLLPGEDTNHEGHS